MLNKIKVLTEIDSLPELDQYFTEILAAVGADSISYNLYVPSFSSSTLIKHTLCTLQVKKWQEFYASKAFNQVDPIFDKIRHSQLPFGWNLIDEKEKFAKQGYPIFEAALDFGLTGGFAVPVHGPNGEFGNLVIQNELESKRIQAHSQAQYFLQLATHYYHARVNELLEDGKCKSPVLTQREVECLRLTATHKTAKQIARTLSITPRTVGFHLENAMQKLNAHSKYQAVAIASQLGLLH